MTLSFNPVTTVDNDWKQAERSKARELTTAVAIESHLLQTGINNLSDSEFDYWTTGNTNTAFAQKVIAPKTFNLASIDIFIKAKDTASTYNAQNKFFVKLYTVSGGEPDTLLAQTYAIPLKLNYFQWLRFTFDSVISLTNATEYWIVIATNATDDLIDPMTGTAFLATDDYVTNYPAGYYDDGGNFNVDTSRTFLTRLISDTLEDNLQEITEIQSWDLNRDIAVPSNSFSANVVNYQQKYSINNPYNNYLQSGRNIFCYVGLKYSGSITYYQIFNGITNTGVANKDTVTINANCYINKMLKDKMTSSTLVSTALEDIIENVAQHSGISAITKRVTGYDSNSYITFQDILSWEIAKKCLEITGEVFQCKNDNTPIMQERNTIYSLDDGSLSVINLNDSDFILDVSEEILENELINRITITNDTNGETSSDGIPLSVGDYQTIGTASGTLTAYDTDDITITFTEYACIYIQFSCDTENIIIREISRSCGDYNTYGEIQLRLTNKRGVNSAYNITVKGCPINNATSNTILSEYSAQQSWDNYGHFGERYDNDIIGSQAMANSFAQSVLYQKALPRTFIKINARGMVDVFPNDIVRIKDNKQVINDNGIINSINYNFNVSPVSFTMYLEVENSNFSAVSFLVTDETKNIITDDGKYILV